MMTFSQLRSPDDFLSQLILKITASVLVALVGLLFRQRIKRWWARQKQLNDISEISDRIERSQKEDKPKEVLILAYREIQLLLRPENDTGLRPSEKREIIEEVFSGDINKETLKKIGGGKRWQRWESLIRRKWNNHRMRRIVRGRNMNCPVCGVRNNPLTPLRYATLTISHVETHLAVWACEKCGKMSGVNLADPDDQREDVPDHRLW